MRWLWNGWHVFNLTKSIGTFTFTHLDIRKNSLNFIFAKTDAKQKKSQKAGNQTDQFTSPLGKDLVRCTNDDLTRGGQEIVETTCENSYIHFNM